MTDYNELAGLSGREVGMNINKYTDDQLKRMRHSTLYSARDFIDKKDQNRVANFEHRAFAREVSKENPLMSIPVALATPGYQIYKMFDARSRSDPSFDQIDHGMLGVGEGLWSRFQDEMAPIQNRIANTDMRKRATDLALSLQSYLPNASTANMNRPRPATPLAVR